MLYWLENVKRCPEDGYPFKKPSKYARHNSAKDVRIAVYECPSCRRTFLKYPGAQIAAATDTSTYYLSIHERDKVKAQKEENLLKERHAAWAAKQERDRLEQQRLEEQRKREQEAKIAADKERKRRLLAEYTTDELFVADL